MVGPTQRQTVATGSHVRTRSTCVPVDAPDATVLVVDDDLNIRIGTQLRLQSAGYNTIEADNGVDALSMAIQQQPQAILLDIHMPHMNGIETLKALRQHNNTKQTPVIMLSASRIERLEALDNGARFFLTKPYQPDNMLNTIHKALTEER
ncbi:MAG: response regulator [Planctomycetaceae bacterium]